MIQSTTNSKFQSFDENNDISDITQTNDTSEIINKMTPLQFYEQ